MRPLAPILDGGAWPHMQELLDDLAACRAACARHAENLGKRHGVSDAEPPLDGLKMAFNQTTTCLEACSYYHEVWTTRIMPPEGAARRKQENIERLMIQTRALFVFTLSIIEFSGKQRTLLTRRSSRCQAGGNTSQASWASLMRADLSTAPRMSCGAMFRS
jgi:hypothetical protein